jgi:flagellar motor switch protein FliG
MQANAQLRKAAVLVASLDQATADALLDQLSPDEADLVRRLVVSLEEIDADEQQAAIGQFLGNDAVEDDRPSPSPAPVREDPPFQFLHEARPEQLLPLLKEERPQTIAVVVSHLPPEQAAELLFLLEPALQNDVMRRLVDLEEADPATLRELEQGLEERVARHVQTERRRTAGLTALIDILEAAGSPWQGKLQANLIEHAPQLARQLPVEETIQRTYTFDDLSLLGDTALASLLEQAAPQTTILALAGARPNVAERWLSQLPPHEAHSLRSAWQQLGPTPLSDIEDAQQDLVRLACDLRLLPDDQAALV